MGTKQKEKEYTRERVSVTPKPQQAKLIEEMLDDDDTSVTRNQLFTIGIDILHMVWTVLKAGGELGVKMPGQDNYQPIKFFIPGLNIGPD